MIKNKLNTNGITELVKKEDIKAGAFFSSPMSGNSVMVLSVSNLGEYKNYALVNADKFSVIGRYRAEGIVKWLNSSNYKIHNVKIVNDLGDE